MVPPPREGGRQCRAAPPMRRECCVCLRPRRARLRPLECRTPDAERQAHAVLLLNAQAVGCPAPNEHLCAPHAPRGREYVASRAARQQRREHSCCAVCNDAGARRAIHARGQTLAPVALGRPRPLKLSDCSDVASALQNSRKRRHYGCIEAVFLRRRHRYSSGGRRRCTMRGVERQRPYHVLPVDQLLCPSSSGALSQTLHRPTRSLRRARGLIEHAFAVVIELWSGRLLQLLRSPLPVPLPVFGELAGHDGECPCTEGSRQQPEPSRAQPAR